MLSNLTVHRGLKKGLDSLNLAELTDVQEQVIPAALAGENLLVSAETGSGKTLAYLIPAAQGVLETQNLSKTGTLVLILVPTRELARQVQKHFLSLSKHTALKSGVITGGNSFKYQQAVLRKNPEFIISTPGRLVELLDVGSADLTSLKTLVLDEADRMLDMGFREDVLKIIAACNARRQTLLLSATLRHRGISHIAREVLSDAQHVTVEAERGRHRQIQQQVILCDDANHKQKLLSALLDSGTRALVFANTRARANTLGAYLRYRKIRAGVLHGELSQEERNHVTALFAEGKVNVLVASDVAARGLDIKDIDIVVNVDFPRSVDDYIHRIGRTGRAGRQGLAVSFVAANDWNPMVSIERHNGEPLERRVIKGLKAKFKGPKKVKSSGRAAGSRKNKTMPENKKASRHRNSKNKGKPGNRKKSQPKTLASSDGLAPLTKRSNKTGE